jgi:hypothetical protein
MSCCGGQRAAQRTNYQTAKAGAHDRSSVPVKSVTFEYSGARTLAVTGPYTGATYRFPAKGARLIVHGSDAPSLLSVPGLKPVS